LLNQVVIGNIIGGNNVKTEVEFSAGVNAPWLSPRGQRILVFRKDGKSLMLRRKGDNGKVTVTIKFDTPVIAPPHSQY